MSRWRFLLGLFGIVLFFGVLSLGFYLWLTPEHTRLWELGQERLPVAHIEDDVLSIGNVRDFTWSLEGATERSDGKYETRTYHLDQVQGIDVYISHFSSFEGLAHIFLSFTFADSDPLVLSVESRREVGESFSPWKGLFAQYELMVVAGTERDLVGVRGNVRQERLYRYPTVATPEIARELLNGLVTDMQMIESAPRFYHTLTNNCTNFVTRRVAKATGVEFPLTWKSVFPGYFETVLLKLGLLQIDQDTAWNKERYRIQHIPALDDPDFSQHLRDQKFQNNS